MPKFFIKTYGCQMNERDSEQVAHSLAALGYERVGHESEADVVLLNTCSVRDMADQKAFGKMGMLGRLAKERPHMVFGFLGCMAQARGASLLKDLPHVDLVVGTQKFHRVADYVDEIVARKKSRISENAQRSTSNVQRPIPESVALALFLVRCWTLDVGRWTFSLCLRSSSPLPHHSRDSSTAAGRRFIIPNRVASCGWRLSLSS
jgi:tRNA A37 methylthiotransferase MiaB